MWGVLHVSSANLASYVLLAHIYNMRSFLLGTVLRASSHTEYTVDYFLSSFFDPLSTFFSCYWMSPDLNWLISLLLVSLSTLCVPAR